jgi:hypothetical protein
MAEQQQLKREGRLTRCRWKKPDVEGISQAMHLKSLLVRGLWLTFHLLYQELLLLLIRQSLIDGASSDAGEGGVGALVVGEGDQPDG